MKNDGTHMIIATRTSKLAIWQANFVKQKLEALYPTKRISFLTLTTSGDKRTDVSLAHIGGKDLFAKELQRAVLEKEADIAVHSLKDLGAQTPTGLTLGSVCERDDPRDTFISTTHKTFASLPKGAIVGTSSPRRQCQLLALRPDLQIKLLRGNVETRLRKLQGGQYDAIVLAAAGLKRLKLEAHITEYFNPTEFIPAISQGVIAIECRQTDNETQALLTPLTHIASKYCVTAERAVNYQLKGDCFTPVGAFATLHDNKLHLKAMVGSLDGSQILSTELVGPCGLAQQLGIEAANQLLKQGANRFLQAK